MPDMKPNIHRLLELQRLLSDLTQVERKTYRPRGREFVRENDAEHSYSLAMMAWFLAQWFPQLDRNLLIRYALVHDLVEAYAGDTPTHGSEELLATKAEREAKAIEQLKKDWPDFAEANNAIDEYENRSTNEARFIYALDKVMPMMLGYNTHGYAWKMDGFTTDKMYQAKHDKVALSPEIQTYFKALLELLHAKPKLFDPK